MIEHIDWDKHPTADAWRQVREELRKNADAPALPTS